MGIGADDFSAPSGNSFKFDELGKTVVGQVAFVGDWHEREGKFGVSTQIKIGLKVDGEDELVYIYPKKGYTDSQAIADALREAGLPSLEVGQTLKLGWTKNKDTGKGNPLKMFQARVTPAPAGATFDASTGEEDPF